MRPHSHQAAAPASGAPPALPSDSTPLLWTLDETCKQLSIGKSTAERLMSAGRFPKAIRIGRSLRFRPADVRAWLDEQAGRKGGGR